MMCIFLPSLAAFTVFSFYYGFQKFDYHVPRFGFLCIYSAWDFVELLGDTHMCVCVFTFKKLLTFFFFQTVFLFTLFCTVFSPWDYSSCMLDVSPIIETVLYFLVFFSLCALVFII